MDQGKDQYQLTIIVDFGSCLEGSTWLAKPKKLKQEETIMGQSFQKQKENQSTFEVNTDWNILDTELLWIIFQYLGENLFSEIVFMMSCVVSVAEVAVY